MDWKQAAQLQDTDTVAGMMFQGLKQLETIRKAQKVFVSYADTWTVDTRDASVLCIGRYFEGETLYGIFNFSETDRTAWLDSVAGDGTDLITGEKKNLAQIEIPAYGYFYLKK